MEPTGSTQGSASTCSEWEIHIPTPGPCSRLWLVGPPGAGITAADVTGLAVNVVLPVARGESAVISISLPAGGPVPALTPRAAPASDQSQCVQGSVTG